MLENKVDGIWLEAHPSLMRTITTPGLDRVQRLRLAAAALVDERSLGGAYNGLPTRPLTYERILRAAKKLGLPLPPPQVSQREEARAAS
jgi:hypothetical protein